MRSCIDPPTIRRDYKSNTAAWIYRLPFRQSTSGKFAEVESRYEAVPRDLIWKNNRILNVDLAARTADMLVKFKPNSECMFHRHACCTTTLVLEGELRVREQVDGTEVLKVKPAGSYSRGGFGSTSIA